MRNVNKYRLLTIPEGLTPLRPLNPDFPEDNDRYFREYLKFSTKKFDEICEELASKIGTALEENKNPNIIIPLNGGILFLYFLTEKLKQHSIDLTKISFIFAFKDSSGKTVLPKKSISRFDSAIFLIDDIWDTGNTGEDIFKQAKLQIPTLKNLYCYAFSKKVSSPRNKGEAVLRNQKTIINFPDQWICSGFGMNSGLFKKDPLINALERTSFLPLAIEADRIKSEDIKDYYNLLTLTNLATNLIIPAELVNLIEELENQNLDGLQKAKMCNQYFGFEASLEM